jgi:alpha-1,6-mannosyltransferase
MQRHSTVTSRYTFYFVFIVAISFIQLQVDRSQSLTLGIVYTISFFTYGWLTFAEKIGWRDLVIVGLVARLLLFFSLPSLSDDFYRFLWDGMLIREGVSPYSTIPELSSLTDPTFRELLPMLNSPAYYSVYPPLMQLQFFLATSISESMLAQVNTMRIFAVLADYASVYILYQFLGSDKKHLAAAFFLNPLLILESTGNLHSEGLLIAVLMVALFWLRRQKWIYAGGWIGLAVGIKLLPAMWIPFTAWRHRWRDALMIGLGILITGITLAPLLIDHQYEGLLASIELYRKKFEFNGSIYYLFREIGFAQKGYNIIGTLGPALAKWSLALILIYSWLAERLKKPVPETFMLIWTIYLLLSSSVHPWYILPLIPLGLMGGYYFPIIWSFLIFTTYFGYQATGYEHPYLWIVIEYTLTLSYLGYEIYLHTKKPVTGH